MTGGGGKGEMIVWEAWIGFGDRKIDALLIIGKGFAGKIRLT